MTPSQNVPRSTDDQRQNMKTKGTETKDMETNCTDCGALVCKERWELGYSLCLLCGEAKAKKDRGSWCVAALHKSNYLLITNPADLRGINNKYSPT